MLHIQRIVLYSLTGPKSAEDTMAGQSLQAKPWINDSRLSTCCSYFSSLQETCTSGTSLYRSALNQQSKCCIFKSSISKTL